MRLISLFSGCGGLDLGFEKAGFEIAAANESDKAAWATYCLNCPNTYLINGNVQDIPATAFPDDVDGVIGGLPRQAWCAAGKAHKIDDVNSPAFCSYVHVLNDKKPKFFLAENANVLSNSDYIRSVQNTAALFVECGYDVSATLVDAKNYGVAQERKHVFYIGFRKDLGVKFQFPRGSTERKKLRVTLRDVIWDLKDTAVPADALNKHNPAAEDNNEFFSGQLPATAICQNRTRSWDEQAFAIQPSAKRCQFHPQLSAADETDKENPRRLTVRECARIQGFPDSFHFVYSNIRDGYKMIGNAVPVNLAYAVATAIHDAL